MKEAALASSSQWSEGDSQTFLDYGRYFVPEREQQIETICALIPPRSEPFYVIELCCGEGLLAGAILERHAASTVCGYDGSPEMLQAARQRLANYGERFQTQPFDLASFSWRQPGSKVHAVVSSLAIHHLDGDQKQQIYRDLYALLSPGGVLVIADVILPATSSGEAVAATAWDRAVQTRAQQLDGNLAAFAEFQRLGWNMYREPNPDDFDKPSRLLDQLRWLDDAGFSDVDVYWMLAGHAIFGGRKSGDSPQ
jgi:tRNA (cmo5U34)-methyltransferase